jgi:PAS domain S-box-containing protein
MLEPGANPTDSELAAILESSDDAIIGKTLDGTITSWNPAAERMYGYSAVEAIGRSIMILLPSGRAGELSEILERIRTGERIEHFETVRVRKDGTQIDVSLMISPIVRGGSVVGASTIARDVTSRRRAESRANETLALLEAIEATAPVGLAFVDREFRIVRVNRTLAAVQGTTVEELVGLPIGEVIPEVWPDVRSVLADVLETGEPVTGREFVFPDAASAGEVRHWLTSFHPVSVDRQISGIGIVAFDISERKQMEEALRTAKEYAERLIDTSNAIVLVLDADADVKGINKAGEEITGYTRDELMGRNWDIVVPRDRFPAAWGAFETLIEGGLERYENPIVTKSGKERIVLWRNAQVLENDVVTGTISFGIDVTESVQTRREAEQSHELLRVADQERRALLRRLVHAQEDERQRVAGEIHDDPLQALFVLAMNLELLAKGVDDPALLSNLSEAREAVRTALASLRQMIFTLHPLVLEQEGLARALDDQLEKMRQETGIDVALKNALTRQPPNATGVIAFRIAQEALMNIRKHARARQVDVHLAETAEGLVVRIADDGRGFELRANEPGHLGLISMRERAEMAGGWFRTESNAGQGTTVEFLLPLIAE